MEEKGEEEGKEEEEEEERKKVLRTKLKERKDGLGLRLDESEEREDTRGRRRSEKRL